MKVTLKPLEKSNYEVSVEFENSDLVASRATTLTSLQQDFVFEGYETGSVPFEIIERNSDIEMLSAKSFEALVNAALQKIVSDANLSLQWIGQPYELIYNEDKPLITFKLDVYPKIVKINDDFGSIFYNEIKSDVSNSEIDEALYNLRLQFSTDFTPVSVIENNCYVTVEAILLGENDQEINRNRQISLNPEHLNNQLLRDLIGKQLRDTVSLPYNEDYKRIDGIDKIDFNTIESISKIKLEIRQISQVNLISADELVRQFGEVNSIEEIRKKIRVIIEENKFENELTKNTDEYISTVSKSFTVAIPQTMLNEEVNHRLEALKNQFDTTEKFNEFLATNEQEGKADAFNKIKKAIEEAATQSLEKFFVFREILEQLSINNINWEAPMDAEKKLYEKLLQLNRVK